MARKYLKNMSGQDRQGYERHLYLRVDSEVLLYYSVLFNIRVVVQIDYVPFVVYPHSTEDEVLEK